MTYTPSPQQQAVIDATAPIVIVLGGAGSGKTTTAAAAAARRLESMDAARDVWRSNSRLGAPRPPAPPRLRVLFLSFSRTAVSQILDRAAGVLGGRAEHVDVVTFHGLAWRILNDFGRFYGHSHPIRVKSRAEAELTGTQFPGVSYDDLVPAAESLLKISTISDYYARRYSTVICDEFQDTSDTEWRFIQAVAPRAQRILLGDPNQCIWAGMKHIDPDARIAGVAALPGAITIELPPQSYRDPSGILPGCALAALERRFDDPAIGHAVRMGRVVVHRVDGDDLLGAVSAVVREQRARNRTVSIFTHTHAATTELSSALSQQGLEHEQVGFTESFGDGLQAQFALLCWTLDGTVGARAALAAYARSISTGNLEKRAASRFLDRSDPQLESRITAFTADLRLATCEFDKVLDLVAVAHRRLGFIRGEETWLQAARQLRRAARILDAGGSVDDLATEVQDLRVGTLVGSRSVRPRPTQVMNLHQTKGREADATVLLLQPDEFHGFETEPYPTNSRLMYVCLTRARLQAHIVVPDAVDRLHGLWAPFVDACNAARQITDCAEETCWGQIQWQSAMGSEYEYEYAHCDHCGTLNGRCPACDEVTAFHGGGAWDCVGCGAQWTIMRRPGQGDWMDWTPPSIGDKVD